MIEEAQAVGLFTSRLAKAMIIAVGVEHVYSFVIGDGVPHVHVQINGRYPCAPRDYWGPKVDEWPDAPRGDASDISKLARRMRYVLAELA